MNSLIANQPDALTVLFERHAPLVFRIARRILRNDAEAEDAVQQIFLDIFRSAAQFDAEKGSFKAWLLMFAYHRTFNARRHLAGRGFYVSDSIEEELPKQLIEDTQQSVLMAPAEISVLLKEVLNQTQPRQRRVIELTYYHGLTAEQISKITGESVRVVRHNLYRGLEKLRSVLCGREKSMKGKKQRVAK